MAAKEKIRSRLAAWLCPLLLLLAAVAASPTASALTPGAWETRTWEKSFAPLESRQADPQQALELRQANASCAYELAPESLLAANRTPVFWSGGRAAEDAARTFANANSGLVIGDTAAGRALAQSTANVPWSQARPQWLSLSEDFARSASGQVNVFQNARGVAVDSIWRNEYQILMQNPNVTRIDFNVVMPNGSVVPVP